MKRRSLLQLAASGAALAGLPARAAPLEELRLDYAHYSPTSLVLRHFGWLEEAFKADGTSRPEWTALGVPKNSPIRSLADLKGKKVAATEGF